MGNTIKTEMFSYFYEKVMGSSEPPPRDEADAAMTAENTEWSGSKNDGTQQYSFEVPQWCIDKPVPEMDHAMAQRELLALADEYMSNFENYSVVIDDPENNYLARQTWNGDSPVTIIKYRAKGMTAEHMEKYMKDPIEQQIKCNNRAEAIHLPDHEGHRMY